MAWDMDEIHAWYRSEKNKEAREDFGKYSWGKWFEALNLPELQALADSWWKVIQYAEGHELLVMRWNQQQLHRTILVRQGATLMGGDVDQPDAVRKTRIFHRQHQTDVSGAADDR